MCRSMEAAIEAPRLRSRSSEYMFNPPPMPRSPMCSASYLSGLASFGGAISGLARVGAGFRVGSCVSASASFVLEAEAGSAQSSRAALHTTSNRKVFSHRGKSLDCLELTERPDPARDKAFGQSECWGPAWKE